MGRRWRWTAARRKLWRGLFGVALSARACGRAVDHGNADRRGDNTEDEAITDLTILQPPGWRTPRGYSNGIAGAGRVVMIGGQIGWDQQGRIAGGFVAQAAQALRNVLAVLQEAGGRPEHIARLTWYVVDIEEYRQALAALGSAYRDTLGRWYPAMTLVQVSALVEPGARVEIEATAIIG